MAPAPNPLNSAATVPSILLPELLGFSPHFILDGIINAANQQVLSCVEAVETFITRWYEERDLAHQAAHSNPNNPNSPSASSNGSADWDGTVELEQGLVRFQTMLEYHTDVAFDFFETWSLRNIFAIPPELEIVAPHHEGLDLELGEREPGRELELLGEIEELRRKIENVCFIISHAVHNSYQRRSGTQFHSPTQQKRVTRLYTRALRAARFQAKRATTRRERLQAIYPPHTLQSLRSLPPETLRLYNKMSSLPPIDLNNTNVPVPDAGKREWERGKVGYLSWAVGQLVEREREEMAKEGGAGGARAKIEDMGAGVGDIDDVKGFLEQMGEDTAGIGRSMEMLRQGQEAMDTSA